MNVSLVLVTALTLSAPALKDPPKNPDDLTGEWVLEKITIAGRASLAADLVYNFTPEGKWVIHREGKELVAPNRGYAFNPKADPPSLELISDTARQDVARREGIYKIEGDTLTMCVAPAKKPRPAKWDSTAENGHTIYVMKRKKK